MVATSVGLLGSISGHFRTVAGEPAGVSVSVEDLAGADSLTARAQGSEDAARWSDVAVSAPLAASDAFHYESAEPPPWIRVKLEPDAPPDWTGQALCAVQLTPERPIPRRQPPLEPKPEPTPPPEPAPHVREFLDAFRARHGLRPDLVFPGPSF